MAKHKVKLKFDGSIKVLKTNLVDNKTQNTLGEAVIEMMKDAMSKGLSPVKGFGRFIGYSSQRNNNKSSYPFNVKHKYPSKKVRPVNLKLSGDLYDSIGFKGIKQGVEIGHINMTSEIKEKFEKHNEGSDILVPQRKYLPNKRGETFIVTIMQMIKYIYTERIKFIINNNR